MSDEISIDIDFPKGVYYLHWSEEVANELTALLVFAAMNEEKIKSKYLKRISSGSNSNS